MGTTPLRFLGALVAVALLITACGSDTTTTDTATTDTATTDTATTDTAMTDDHGEDDHGEDDHSHVNVIEVDPDKPIPAVDIEVTETDTPGVFDLTVTLTNFTVTPDNVDGDPIDNEGHMHFLLDGTKVDRFTDLQRQIMVPDGEHLVEVEINANNHAAYALDGVPIRAGVTVIGAGEADSGDHGDTDDDHDHAAAGPAIEDGLSADDATVAIAATITGGDVSLDGDDRIEATVGDVVSIMVTADIDDEVHLHGYDLLAPVAAGETAMIVFTADTPGKFEIELETSGVFVAELIVS